jgi:hypothetical protein
MTVYDAFHLPGLTATDVSEWRVLERDGCTLRYPVLNAGAWTRLLDRMRTARGEVLERYKVADVVSLIDATAERITADGRDDIIERLSAATGYSPEMTRLVVDRMAAGWRAPALNALLSSEFDDPLVLDDFRAHGAVHSHVTGPPLSLHVFAGNVPGVAVTSLVRSLLVKSAVLGKSAAGDALLPAEFARTLAGLSPALGSCVAVTYWPGGEQAVEQEVMRAVEQVVFYGGEAAESDLRSRLPAGTWLIVHGARLSFGVVARSALNASRARQAARDIARAVAVFDQQGCVSPHVVYVERGGQTTPAELAMLIAQELARLDSELPRGVLSAAESSHIHQARAAAEFSSGSDRLVTVHAGAGTSHTVVYDDDSSFTPSCLNRFVYIKPVSDLHDVPDLVRPFARYLQSVAVAAEPATIRALAPALAALGISRVTDFERLPWPPATWHHDGHGPLRELVRFTDLETA